MTTMVMSTQTLAESSRLMSLLLMDEIQVYTVGDPVTVGFEVVKEMTPVGSPIPALVQSISLENTIEGITSSAWSIKVAQGTPLEAGQAIMVLRCTQEPSLVGRTLLLDKVSENGAAMIRKAVAVSTKPVNQEGKGDL